MKFNGYYLDMKSWERIPEEHVKTYVKICEYAGKDFYRRIAKRIAEDIGKNPKREIKLLDIGTAHGMLLYEISRLVEGTYIGIDCTLEFSKYFKKYTKDKARFVAADAYRLPFKENYFDYIVSTGVLHGLRCPDFFFEEIYRVLRYGGKALVVDPTPLKMEVSEAKKILDENELRIFMTYREQNLKFSGSEIPSTFEKEDIEVVLKNFEKNINFSVKKEDCVLTIFIEKHSATQCKGSRNKKDAKELIKEFIEVPEYRKKIEKIIAE